MYTGSMFTIADNCVATTDASKPPPESFDSDGGYTACDYMNLISSQSALCALVIALLYS